MHEADLNKAGGRCSALFGRYGLFTGKGEDYVVYWEYERQRYSVERRP